MRRSRTTISAGLGAALVALAGGQATADYEEVLRTLNSDDTVKGTEQSKSYRLLFDAYLELSPPPFEVGEDFNQTTIHPGMRDWALVSDWAESNPMMAEAIIRCRDRNIIGLPYGEDAVEPAYRDAGLVAVIAAERRLHNNQFRYLDALDTIAAYATAEIYRRMEAGQVAEALELAVGFYWVLRQFCDRHFLEEKQYGIELLIEALANLRDVFFRYPDKISSQQYLELAWYDIPELRPDRNRLHIPEGDRVVSEALLEAVFDERTRSPDPEKFALAFASIQSADAPLTRFGAARRWRMIAAVHDSLEASKERLALIYDDWWRRWRVEEYDPIVETATQFQRTNPIRYAAVIYSIESLEGVYHRRNELIGAVNGTAMAAGLCGYKKRLGVYPGDQEKLYGQFVRKRSDVDPYDDEYGPLRYIVLPKRESADVPAGRLWLEKGDCVLYSLGRDHVDDRARQHTDHGTAGEIVFWPPIKAISRAQGLVD